MEIIGLTIVGILLVFKLADTWHTIRYGKKQVHTKYTLTMVAVVIPWSPWCPTPAFSHTQQSVNMMRNKSMPLKLYNSIVIITY